MKRQVLKTTIHWFVLVSMCHAGPARAEDIDIFRTRAKNTAMMVLDTSGSMSFPVYDHRIDYAALMRKMIDTGVAEDENDCRSGSSWWDINETGEDYDRLVPDRIYLVSTWSRVTDVSWTDSSGVVRQVKALDDIMQNIGSETDSSLNRRYPFLTNAIIPVLGRNGNHWCVSSPATIGSDAEGHVIFPSAGLRDMAGHPVVVSSDLSGTRLPNGQDIPVSGTDQDPLTGEYYETGFSGRLGWSGVYFSGCYEKEGEHIEITPRIHDSEFDHGGARVYCFATGNWLNFIKLVEDFRLVSLDAPCIATGAYPHQRLKFWRYACLDSSLSNVDLCCGAGGAYEYKIRSRLDVAEASAMRILMDTGHMVNWGLMIPNGDNGGRVAAPPGTGVDSIVDILAGLEAGGAFPVGEAMQDAYLENAAYLEAHREASGCANNFLVIWSAGFPSGDDDWRRIDDDEGAENVHAPEFGSCPDGNGSDCEYYGDADTWPVNNFSDDVSHWLYHEAGNTHSVLTVAVDGSSAMLMDVADSSSGLHILPGREHRLVDVLLGNGYGIANGPSYTAPVSPVQASNRTRHDNFIYATCFKPERDACWRGNLKKYGLSSATIDQTDTASIVVDRYGNEAVSSEGRFRPEAVSFWSNAPDGGHVTMGGAGGLLKASIDRVDIRQGPYYDFRNIYTCKEASASRQLVRFWRDGDRNEPDTILPSDLGLTGCTKESLLKRDMIINHVYGYTFDAVDSGGSVYNEGADGAPLARRDWILGDIIHSEPCMIDYVDPDHNPMFRFIAVGANDGMLHVFADSPDPEDPDAPVTIGDRTYRPGDEIWAFIPGDLLPKLTGFEMPNHHRYFVDGACTLYAAGTWHNAGSNSVMRGEGEYYDKVLVFGERRGGRSYWALDVSKPNPLEWSVIWQLRGGESPDDFSEHLGLSWSKPVLTSIKTGPASSEKVVVFGGGYDPEEDHFPEPWIDGNHNGVYDAGNPEDIFDVNDSQYDAFDNDRRDEFNPEQNEIGCGIFVVRLSDGSTVFKATFGPHNGSTQNGVTLSEMTYCFPADPSVIELPSSTVIYLADIYGTIWKVDYEYSRPEPWGVKKVFMSNPGSGQPSAISAVAGVRSPYNMSERGRKMFYSPDISWLGNEWTRWPVLYFGTGDRSHPNYVPAYHNRFYVVSDTGQAAGEADLLNLTCDELDSNADTNQNGVLEMGGFGSDADLVAREMLYTILFGDEHYPEDPSVCRGWYRVLGLQGECTQGNAVSHVGEMCVSRPVLFNGSVYFSTFQPHITSPCQSGGHAFVYALDYSFGNAAHDMNRENTVSALADAGTLEDTFRLVENCAIPSGVRIVSCPRDFSAVMSIGTALSGIGAEESPGNGQSTGIPSPPGGLVRLLWDSH